MEFPLSQSVLVVSPSGPQQTYRRPLAFIGRAVQPPRNLSELNGNANVTSRQLLRDPTGENDSATTMRPHVKFNVDTPTCQAITRGSLADCRSEARAP
jgi:hypothetical protein